MPRSLVLGNGKLQVNFDTDYVLRDLFYPRVGMENHFAGERCRTGVWSDGRFLWTNDPTWERQMEYLEDSLVTHVRLYQPQWKLEVVFNDAVDLDRTLLLRRVTVTNHAERPQEVRLFFHYDFHIYGVEVGDTVYYDPALRAMVAYKGRRHFIANVKSSRGIGVDTWATGNKEVRGLEGTWRDAEDGQLQENPIAQGSVDGTVALALGVVAPGTSGVGHHWLAVAESKLEVEDLDRLVRERGPDSFIDRTRDWWRAWRRKDQPDFADLSPETRHLFNRSLLTIRTHIDNGGAIIASTDSDITVFNRDTYAYCWPRDGALTAIALDRAGYSELSRRFFEFCFSVLNPFDGYFRHKFSPNGELASSWHPWLGPDKEPQLPIQEDETGLVLHALWEHYRRFRDIEFIKPFYRPLIRGCADFMVRFRDSNTGLPLPSYDLWEERRGIHAFTVAAVWAGLKAAANFADTFNQRDLGDVYHQVAEQIRAATLAYLWDSERGRFARTLHPTKSGSFDLDPTLDAGVLALSLFGMLDARDPKVVATVNAVRKQLWCNTAVGGLARYENDSYYRQGQGGDGAPGNPWFICTLWLAQQQIAAAQTLEDLEPPRSLLQWANSHALPSGLLAEQIDPHTGQPLAVCPLMWSHAAFVAAVQDYVDAYRRLGGVVQPR